MAYFGVIFFADMGRGGGQNYFQVLLFLVIRDLRCLGARGSSHDPLAILSRS